MAKDPVELQGVAKFNPYTGEALTTEEALNKRYEIVQHQLESQISLSSGKDVVEQAIKENDEIVKMIENVFQEGVHYGTIPNTKTKSLLQAGADTLTKTYGVKIKYELVEKTIDIKNHYIDYEYKAFAYWQEKLLGEATASANTLESKFRSHFQKVDRKTGEWVQIAGKSAFDNKNTIQQMAQKRANLRVVRKIFGITGAFTQDMLDTYGKASSDETKSVYNTLYLYEKKELGKNKDERRNFLKLNVLKPACEEVAENRNMTKWTSDDVEALNDLLNKKEWVIQRIETALKEV